MSEASDLAFMLSDAPASVEIVIAPGKDQVERTVPFDCSEDVTLAQGGAGVIGKTISVVVATVDFPNVRVGTDATVGGVAHRVIERLQLDDGALTRLTFERA